MKSSRELLFKAVVDGDIREIKRLIEAKADVKVRDYYGNTVLMVASGMGLIEVVQLLIEAGADVNAHHDKGLTPLMFASFMSHKDVVKLLIETGADVNAKDKKGKSALGLSVFKGHKDIAQKLIEAGADVNSQNHNGYTLLMLASEEGHAEIVEMLIEAGANINSQNSEGWTALMFASNRGHTRNVKLLIEAGVDVSIQNNNEWTALMIAMKNRYTAIEQLLIPVGFQFGNDRKLIHVYSGAVFEEKIGGLERIDAVKYDNVGKDVIVSYKYFGESYDIFATIFVYPTRTGTATDDCIRNHYPHMKNAVFIDKKNVHMVFEQEDIFDFPSGERFGIFAGFNLEMNNKKNMSFLYLFGEKEWFIKFRISSPSTVHGNEDVSNAIANIVSSFDYSTIN